MSKQSPSYHVEHGSKPEGKLRVLLAHNLYTVTGGAEVFYHEIGRVLKANGHEVAYFSCAEDGLDNSHSEYFPKSADYKNSGLIGKAINFPKMIYNKGAKQKMAKLIEDFKPDIIHAFAIYVRLTPSILEAAKEAGVPVVMSCNDYKHICPNYKLFHSGSVCEDCKGGKFYSALKNRCCHNSAVYSAASMIEAYAHQSKDIWRKNVDCFLFASEFMAKKTQEFWGADSFKYDMLRNPFDGKANKLDGKIGDYFLYFGRLIDEKGVDILAEAAQKITHKVIIVGDGPDRDKIESYASQYKNIEFVGPQWGEDLHAYLRDARSVIVPSIWHENFPYVIFQAFAAGKPVIGSNRGGIPELVAHGERGWIYEALDPQALADQMNLVAGMEDSDLVSMGENNQDYVESNFNDVAIYQRLCEIYESVAA